MNTKSIHYKLTAVCAALFIGFLGMGCSSGKKIEPVSKINTVHMAESIMATEFDFALVPEYAGNPYVVINNNTPYFTDVERITTSFERYSNLDSKGRCGVAYANIGQDIMPTEARGNIGSVKPSGWQTVKYETVDGNYLYNRCHLIGYQLSGENENEKNLITGTRYLNVQGMLPFENMVADYVKETNQHVLYRVTPVFVGDELLSRGVLMEGRSVEDDEIEFCVFCYNVQPYIDINYATGESSEVIPETEPPVQKNNAVTYVLNTNTRKFHYSSCRDVRRIKQKNYSEFTGTREDVMAQGYDPCGHCNP